MTLYMTITLTLISDVGGLRSAFFVTSLTVVRLETKQKPLDNIYVVWYTIIVPKGNRKRGIKMEIVRTIAVKLTEEEYKVLKEAANITDKIVAELGSDDFGEDYDLRDVEHILSAFLEDDNVYVV